MLPSTHFLAGAVCGTLGMRQGILSSGMAVGTAAAAVLLDLDHWGVYLVKTGSGNVFKAWNSSIRRDGRSVRTFVHEPVGVALITVLLGILYWWSRPWGYMFGSAYLSHICLDYLPDCRGWSRKFRIGRLLVRTTLLEVLLALLCGLVLILLYS